MARLRAQKPAGWFWIVAILLLLWGLAGVVAFYSDVTMSDSKLAAMSEFDRQLYTTRPDWVVWAFGLATWSALAGNVALLLRSPVARVLFVVSLIALIAQFGWAFGATGLMAEKGAAATVPFPAFIVAMAIGQLWLASFAMRRGWLR